MVELETQPWRKVLFARTEQTFTAKAINPAADIAVFERIDILVADLYGLNKGNVSW